jgi:beta-mannosidase
MEWFWESRGWAVHEREAELEEFVREIPALAPLRELAEQRELLPDWTKVRCAYDRFFHTELPEWLAELDPDTTYWPSSPSSNTPFRDVNSESQGDAHYWDVWHGRKPFTAYRKTLPRFMSEFGFQAFPAIATIESYTAPEDRNLTSRVMEHHQRGNHGNGLIIAQMSDHFRTPARFADWIYLSHILQAEGIRYGVEHWRRHRDRVGGTLYWQLNDCWPVASWSSIDYHGRWKALHYAARRFYAPVLLSVEDRPPVMDLHVTNDTAGPWSGTVRWSLETLDGAVGDSAEIAVEAAPLADVLIASLDFAERFKPGDERRHVLVTELLRDGETRTLSVHPFVPDKHLDPIDPLLSANVSIRNGQLAVRITSTGLARFVELSLEGAPDTVFSDNHFDLPAGRTHEVTCPVPAGWDEAKAQQAVGLRSLHDSYAIPKLMDGPSDSRR